MANTDPGDQSDEAVRTISLDESRAWVQTRLKAGDVGEGEVRDALDFLAEF